MFFKWRLTAVPPDLKDRAPGEIGTRNIGGKQKFVVVIAKFVQLLAQPQMDRLRRPSLLASSIFITSAPPAYIDLANDRRAEGHSAAMRVVCMPVLLDQLLGSGRWLYVCY